MAIPHSLLLVTVLILQSISEVPTWHRDEGSVCPEVQSLKNASMEEFHSLWCSEMFVSIVTMFTALVAPNDISIDDSKEKF